MAVWMSKPKTRLGRRSNRHMRRSLGFVRRLAPPTGGLMATTRRLRGETDQRPCLVIFFSLNEKDTLTGGKAARKRPSRRVRPEPARRQFSTSITHNPCLFEERPSTPSWITGIDDRDVFRLKKKKQIEGNVMCCWTNVTFQLFFKA